MSAEMSSLSKINIRDRSIGFTMEAISENFSNGYSFNAIRESKNNPSYITAKNNQTIIASPNPLSLFSLYKATKKAMPVKMKVKKAPTTNNMEKFQIAAEAKIPDIAKGIPTPSK